MFRFFFFFFLISFNCETRINLMLAIAFTLKIRITNVLSLFHLLIDISVVNYDESSICGNN